MKSLNVARQLGLCVFLAVVAAPAGAPAGPTPQKVPTTVPTSAGGWKLIADGRYAEAEKMARGLLVRTEARSGPSSVETAEVLDVLCDALWRSGKTKDPEALDLIKKAIDIKEKALGPDHPKVADSLMVQGSILRMRGQFADARPVLERTLAIREHLGEVDVRLGDAELNLATLYRELHELEKAELHFRKALEIYEKTPGPESAKAADSLHGIANCLVETGRLERAERLYERSLRIREEVLGARHPDTGGSYQSLGYLHQQMGEYERARVEMETALQIALETVGEKHPAVIMRLGNLGIIEGCLGLPTNERWERAIALADQTVGVRHHLSAGLRTNYALGMAEGDPIRARQLYEEALATYLDTFGPDHPRTLWVVELLGSVARRLGDLEAASRYLSQAVSGLEKFPGQHVNLASSAFIALANVRVDQGRLMEARPLYERALAMREKVYGLEHVDVAEALMPIGDFNRQTGDVAGAKQAYTRALSIWEKNLGAPQATAGIRLALADVEAEAGDLRKAMGLFERAVTDLEKTRGPEYPKTAEAHQKYATCLLKAGETHQALEQALRAEAGIRPYSRLTVSGLPERQALSFVKKTASGLDVGISAALLDKNPGSPALVLDALVRSRALVLDEMARRHQTAWADNDPGVKSLLDTYVAARQRLANLTVRGPDEKYPEKSRLRLEKAKADKEAAERALAESSPEFRTSKATSEAGLSEIVAALPPHSALVSYVRYPRVEAAIPGRTKPGPAVDSYAVFITRPGRTVTVLVSLGPASDIDSAATAVRRSLAEAAGVSGSIARSAEVSYRRAGAALSRRIWAPLEPHLTGVRTAFIVPDGTLQLISLAALPAGPSSYLLESGPRIHYLSAERDLLLAGMPTGVGLLVAGGPEFDAPGLATVMRAAPAGAPKVYRGTASSCAGFSSLSFKPLPSAKKELEEIASVWRQGTSLTTDGQRPLGHEGEPLLFPGAAANELAVKLNAPGKHIVHLATHAFFIDTCPAGGAAGSGQEPLAKTLSENPLLRSGLALAGANQRGRLPVDVDDGILTAEEIAALDLSGVEWTVLSGCDTGSGEVRTGEGVLGLRRAFHVAGARTLIMSLWPVRDEEGRRFMHALYRNRLSPGATTIDAVHTTCMDRLRGRRSGGQSTHPVFWASFVAAGDWR